MSKNVQVKLKAVNETFSSNFIFHDSNKKIQFGASGLTGPRVLLHAEGALQVVQESVKMAMLVKLVAIRVKRQKRKFAMIKTVQVCKT